MKLVYKFRDAGSARQVFHRETSARRSLHDGGAARAPDGTGRAPRSKVWRSEMAATDAAGAAKSGARSPRERSNGVGASAGAAGSSSTAQRQSSPQRQSPPQHAVRQSVATGSTAPARAPAPPAPASATNRARTMETARFGIGTPSYPRPARIRSRFRSSRLQPERGSRSQDAIGSPPTKAWALKS